MTQQKKQLLSTAPSLHVCDWQSPTKACRQHVHRIFQLDIQFWVMVDQCKTHKRFCFIEELLLKLFHSQPTETTSSPQLKTNDTRLVFLQLEVLCSNESISWSWSAKKDIFVLTSAFFPLMMRSVSEMCKCTEFQSLETCATEPCTNSMCDTLDASNSFKWTPWQSPKSSKSNAKEASMDTEQVVSCTLKRKPK